MKRKIIIRTEIEVEELQEIISKHLKRAKRITALGVYYLECSLKGLVYLAFGDYFFQRTPRKNKPTNAHKNGVYSSEPQNDTPQHIKNLQEEGEPKYVPFVEVKDTDFSSTQARCANPECNQIFTKEKRGNQDKKYCSSKCKDIVNNKRKMNNYHYQEYEN